MNPFSSHNTHLDRSAPAPCGPVNQQLHSLISRALSGPSHATLSELIERTFQRKLELSSSHLNTALNDASLNGNGTHSFKICFEGCTVHVTKMVCVSFDAHAAALSRAGQGLGSGEIVVLESMDLSTGHCFPYHSAFGRFQEILALYQGAIGHPTTNAALNRLNDHLPVEATVQMGVPVKLPRDQKDLPARVLECIRSCVEATHMVAMDEYDMVTAELNRLGQNPLVSIRSFTINRIIYTV